MPEAGGKRPLTAASGHLCYGIRMTALRTSLLMLLGCIGATILAIVASVMFEPRPVFDRDHPDYGPFASQFARAEKAFSAGEDWAVIDLAPVNGGAWRSACLFGGFTRPVERLLSLGATVSASDRQRLSSALGWRAAPVEEFEMLVAFTDEQGQAHFIHFDRGVGAEGQHYEACVTRPKSQVAIASWNTEPTRTPPPILD